MSVSPEAAKPLSTAVSACQISCCECAQPSLLSYFFGEEIDVLPKVMGNCSGELQGLTTHVESLKCRSSTILFRWNKVVPYRG